MAMSYWLASAGIEFWNSIAFCSMICVFALRSDSGIAMPNCRCAVCAIGSKRYV